MIPLTIRLPLLQQLLQPALAALIALGLLVSGSSNAQQAQDLDAIAAVVNNDVVLYSELNTAGSRIAQKLRQAGTPLPPQQVLARQVLERLIVQRLQLQRARETGIRVDDRIVNQAIANIASNNDLSLSEFRRALLSQGIDYATFREEVRDKITLERLTQREIDNRITVSEQEIDDFIKTQNALAGSGRELKLSQIVVNIPDAPSADDISKARAKAEQLRQRAVSGTSFTELAVASSDGGNALQGGDLGWNKQAELPSAFAAAVSTLSSGGISQPVRSPGAFHIIKVDAVRGEQRRIVDQTHVRHILIRVDEQTSAAAARSKLDRLRIRIQGGEDFAKLAKAQSDDTGSAPKGGDLGWVNPGDLVPQFESAMNQLQPNEISQPFASPFGWHIAQVLERRSQDNTDQFQRNQAREAIAARKADEELDAWLRRLRDEAYVDIRLGDSGF